MKAYLVMMALGVAAISAEGVAAQEVSTRAATLRVGGLMYDRGGDQTTLMLGLGSEWGLSRHLIAEVEGTWTAPTTTVVVQVSPSDLGFRETVSHLVTGTAGLQVQALVGRVRPYVGIAKGVFVRYDAKDGGDRFVSHTTAFPAGVRLDLTNRVMLRGELRARFDVHQDGGSGTNLEQTAGFSIRF